MNAAAYARYSTEHQTSSSIAYQMQKIEEYCQAHNITITARYADEVHTLLYVQLFTICMMLLSKKQPTEEVLSCRLNLVKEKNSNPCLNDKAGTFCCVEH